MPGDLSPLSIDVTLPREDVALLTVEGSLDVDTATELRHHLANQFHHGRRRFLLDFSAVPFMDSSGMNVVLRSYQETRKTAGSVHVIAPTPAVRRILDLTGVSLTVPVSESVDEALALVDSWRKEEERSGIPDRRS
ncbi:STAS domain-containing protein [Streptomyces sp. NPDC006465]|uniref:STAS domain-containing protein n=1 Tax=Streptomyces sp. NPDC006465 TaxID=3157174 RepID=UPI0033B02915